MSNDTVIASLKEKIDDLNQKAWEARVNDSPKAFELSQESVNLARSINYPKGLAEGLRSLGFGYVRLFKNDEAAPLLRESLSLFQSLNDLKGQAVVYEYLGIIERNWGNLGHSLELLLKGYDLIQQAGSSEEIEVTSSYQIGVTYKHLGNHESALDYLYKSLSLAKKIGLTLMEAYAINIIGSIYFDNGNYDQALDCYQQGLVIRRQSNDKWGEADSLDNIGFTYLKLNDIDKAIDYCKQSLVISQSTDDKKGEANALLHLAEIYEKADDVKTASKFSNESLEIRKARGDRRGEAEVLLFLANLYKDRNDVEDQIIFEWLSDALKIAGEMKAQDLLSRSYYSLHEFYQKKGDYKRSLAQLESHLHIEKELHKNAINQKVSNLEISHKAEAISQRNKELTELNEQIEKANAELRVEASLERVRAVAMAMKEPSDMLEVCKIISHELISLDVKEIRNVQTAIFYKEKGNYMNYQYYTKHDKKITTETDYTEHEIDREFAEGMLKAKEEELFTLSLEGQKLKDWYAFQQTTPQFADSYLLTAQSLNYYWYSLGPVGLGISTYVPLNEKEIELFKRFRNVFELAYRRYLDIEKALAQAREAQIEVALERVRARSMAMHHSDDLISVINVVKEQLVHLGFHFHGANFVTDYSDKGYTMWLAAPNESFPTKIYVPQLQQKLFKAVADAVEKDLDFTTYTLSFEEKNLYFKNLFENSLAGTTSEEGKKLIFGSKGMAASVVLLSKIRLNLMNLDLIPYTGEENNILKRIAYVFEQSYIRFLDLQKAEAQAREAQIEAALERIRARAMAMHSSNEIMDVANILREQMGLLDQPDLETTVVNLLDEDPQNVHSWHAFRQPGTLGKIISGTLSFPKNSSVLAREMIGLYKEGKKEFTLEASGKKLEEFTQVLINAEPNIAKHTNADPPEKVYYHFTTFTGGAMLTVSYQQPTHDVRSLQRRAASVFDMAYRRYLDLKKAEAQAREAQIEVALEKIRAKVMAMKNSYDLNETSLVFGEQLRRLGIDWQFSYFWLIEDDKDENVFWITWPDHKTSTTTYSWAEADESFRECLIAWQQQTKIHTTHVPAEDVPAWLDTFERITNDAGGIAIEIMRPENFKDGVYYYDAMIRFGSFGILTNRSTNKEEQNIQIRFATEFERAYTRFLDLQKAEAQAREAQIETGLERVRSKTMAMHKSEEVTGVAVSLNEELLKLGFEGGSTIIIINSETGDTEQWTGFSEDKSIKSCYVPYFKHPYHEALLDAWKSDKKFLAYTVAGDEKGLLDDHYFSTGYKIFPENDKKWMREMNSVTFSLAFMKYGAIHWGPDHLAEEQLRILQRFAKVFEQAYTRFLDLQKAEAQARESQIQLALERVRARTMAMQHSSELKEVAAILFMHAEQVGVKSFASGVHLWIEDGKAITIWSCTEGEMLPPFRLPLTEDPAMMHIYEAAKSGKDFHVEAMGGQALKEHYEYLFSFPDIKEIFGNLSDAGFPVPEFQIFHCAYFSYGYLMFITREPCPEVHDIFKRFAKVFDQTYTRFLDLQKAEAQAKEAQIETALERVRSRTMAMHNSADLLQVINVVSEQLQSLGFPADAVSFITESDEKGYNIWLSKPGDDFLSKFYIPRIDDKINNLYNEAIQKGDDFYSYVLTKDEKDIYFKNFFDNTILKQYPDEFKLPVYEAPGMAAAVALMDTITLNVSNFRAIPYTDADKSIIKRFAFVFQQSYTRFLDLQKAEAQARESQIQLALERVRARTMAMHKSDELADVATLLFKQVSELGIKTWTTGFNIWSDDNNFYTDYITNPQGGFIEPYTIDASKAPVFKMMSDAKKRGDKFLVNYEDGKELEETYQQLSKAGEKQFKGLLESGFPFPTQQYEHVVFGAKVSLLFITYEAVPEAHDIFKRFGKVFDQTYTRFLDLQKAEAQAKEAQIEAALERVRSRSLAMHKSDELEEVIMVVSEQLQQLGFRFHNVSFGIINEESGINFWLASPGQPLPFLLKVPYIENKILTQVLQARKENVDFFSDVISAKENQEWLQHLFEHSILKNVSEENKEYLLGTKSLTRSVVLKKHILLAVVNYADVTYADEQNAVLKRFANVFDQAYTRFLDLQMAEAQAREAKIEAALEKVRASTMAMQKSDDLSQTAFVLFNQFKELGETPERIFIATFDDHDRGLVDLWGTDQGGKKLNKLFKLPTNEPTMVSKIIAAWKDRKRSIVVDLKGEELKTYLGFLKQAGIPVAEGIMMDRRVQTAACFSNGVIGVTTSEPQSAESVQLQERFAGVFDLTYRRFLDLQKAEAQAHQARIETALERVRARALAMQQPEELKDVAEVLRSEMGLLGIEELETCSIYIHGESSKDVECWYALQDPKAIEKKMVSDHFMLDLDDTWVGREMKKFYNSGEKQTSIVMQGANRKEWIEYCYKHSPVFSGFYGESIPDRTYHLYKFSHGYIGAAAPGDISAESWRLLSRASSVFSLAYSRFRDLTQARYDLIKLKEEKKRAEDALTELQATQKQLIQSEKMASLGELTAGIAHEIQNPLNFVNNFSDVSNELLEEMKGELATGNTQSAMEIAEGVKDNLEKILHHGKRADAIVKSMLQHSRSSSGKKEPTDINALAEEYFRLAYHGLRAKDKSFNTKFETDLDTSIDKINVVPQEMGRVILNLINNAFYAVNEKKNKGTNGYEPLVTLSTKKIEDTIEIKVKDNGDGISQKVLDKIFHPFFTTKPTGQGTGLGLSLSYDIVTKGHGGDIKVETKEGTGSEFIISLPIN